MSLPSNSAQYVSSIRICLLVWIIIDCMLEWLFGKRKEQPVASAPKPKAQQQAEDKWKYDFLVQFLCGPLWKTSLLDFVDYNCVVFDSEEENKFEYTTIHNKFKELVASLFDSMVQEVGLDDDKLAELLERGFEGKHKKIFNQLLLADDFVRFKTLMVNRNKALQAEAIKALEKQQPQHPQNEQQPPKKEKQVEKDIIRQSKKAEEQRRRQELQEEEQLRKVLQMSRLEAEEAENIKKLQQKAAENELRQSQLAKEAERPLPQPQIHSDPLESVPQPKEQPKPVSNEPLILPPVRRRKKVEQSPKVERTEEKVEPKAEVKVEQQERIPPPVVQPKVQPSPPAVSEQTEAESQQERKKRLLQQREKIRKKKEEQRKKQAVEDELKGSQVQTIVLQQDGIHQTQLRAPEEEKKEKVNNEEIERRRELMRKIKNRIVDDF